VIDIGASTKFKVIWLLNSFLNFTLNVDHKLAQEEELFGLNFHQSPKPHTLVRIKILIYYSLIMVWPKWTKLKLKSWCLVLDFKLTQKWSSIFKIDLWFTLKNINTQLN
jgi:hypothetical protein